MRWCQPQSSARPRYGCEMSEWKELEMMVMEESMCENEEAVLSTPKKKKRKREESKYDLLPQQLLLES
jgi:hypothetical protein